MYKILTDISHPVFETSREPQQRSDLRRDVCSVLGHLLFRRDSAPD